MKKAFSLVEISIVLFMLTAVLFAVVPFSISNIKQAKLTAEWKSYMEQVSYSFETLDEYKKINNLDKKSSIERLMHYLDAKPLIDKNELRNYKYKMLNGNFYQKMNLDKFDDIYIDVDKKLIGVEYSSDNKKIATIWTDLNGVKKPNIVGKDIFIYEIGNNFVSPYGKELKIEAVKSDCSRYGTGMTCSQFYIIGGDLK